jgi:trk system potassium uptake protein TrkH
MLNNSTKTRARPEWIAVKAFGATILLGTALLALPFASSSGQWTNLLTALFTATSATCVTGLIVVDTGSYFSAFGQGVILVLIQIGGLGIMTMGTFLLVLVGRRLRLKEEFVLMDSLGSASVRGLRSLMGRALLFVFLFEALGTAVISYRLTVAHSYPAHKALYYALFHSVSAFCNAGFSLYQDSLTGLRGDPAIVLTVSILIVVGGLGFLVLHNLSSIRVWRRNRKEKGRLSLHTKVVLTATGTLILSMWVLFLVLEWSNTLDGLPIRDRIVGALFQSVTPRTAGFNIVEMAELRPVTFLLTMIAMFIGGSPASTAGGVKTTTIVVLILTVRTMIKAKEETDFFSRSMSMRVVREATAIFLLAIACVLVFYGLMLLTEQNTLLASGACSPDDLLFETISAAATVGLSTGLTSDLSPLGKICIIFCMFIGRLGPMTVALVIGGKDVRQAIKYPREEIVVG